MLINQKKRNITKVECKHCGQLVAKSQLKRHQLGNKCKNLEKESDVDEIEESSIDNDDEESVKVDSRKKRKKEQYTIIEKPKKKIKIEDEENN